MATWDHAHFSRRLLSQIGPQPSFSPPPPPPSPPLPPSSVSPSPISPATNSFISVNPIMTVLGFIFSCAIILCVGGRLLCLRFLYRRRILGQSGRMGLVGEQALASMPGGPTRGMTEAVVQTFPTFKYSSEGPDAVEDTQCVVCIGDYEQNDLLRRLPPCGHYFHVACIDSWLTNHSTCPVCRTSLEPVDPLAPPEGTENMVDRLPLVARGGGQEDGSPISVGGGHSGRLDGGGRGGVELSGGGQEGQNIANRGICEEATLIPPPRQEGGGEAGHAHNAHA